MQFSAVDIIIALCFIPAIIAGISKGLVRQVAGIAALILGVYCAYKFSGLVATKIAPWIDAKESVVSLLSFAITFAGVLFLVIMAGRAAEGIIKVTMLSWVNKLLGVLFALLKTAFILSVIIYFVNYFNESWKFIPQDFFNNSRLYPIVAGIAPKIFPYLKNLTL